MKRIFRLGRGPRSAAHDTSREIETHLALRAQEFEAAGMAPDEARRAALDAFGDRDAVEQEVVRLRAGTVGARRRRDTWSDFMSDLRIGLRMLRRAPGFAAVAILTLAIGIGANTAIFSVLYSVLMRPLPYESPDRLVQVWSDHRARGRATPEWLSPPDYLELSQTNRTFDGIAAYQGWLPDLTGTGDPERLTGAIVTGNYFDVLGTRPALGRLLTVADDDAGVEPVVVISHELWRRRFGGDSSILNTQVTLNGTSWRVVGVLPAAFRAPNGTTDIVRTLRRPANAGCNRGCIVMRAIGRMKPGVTIERAHADLSAISARIAREFPETNENVGAWLVPLHEQIAGQSRAPLYALFGAVTLLLLIACANLANLLLVRGAARTRELGVRAALGAGRWRIARQLLAENTVLALIGGTIGLVIGVFGSRALAVAVPPGIRQVVDIGIDWRAMVFCAVITALSAVLFGLAPIAGQLRSSMLSSLRSGTRDIGLLGRTARRAFAVAQLSIAVVLLVGAGLFLRSFMLMQRVDAGFRTDGVILTNVAFPAARYDDERLRVSLDEVLGRMRQASALRAAEASDITPLTAGDQDIGITPIGEPVSGSEPPSVWYRSVSPGYHQLMNMRLVAGRYFTDADRRGAPMVAIVNEDAARRFWGSQNPVGRELAAGGGPSSPRVTVVGVVASARHDGPTEPYKAELFLPLSQVPARRVTIVAEAQGDSASAIAAMRAAVSAIDPLIPITRIQTMRSVMGDAVAVPRLYAMLVGLFAIIAMLLAILGVYGVIAYTVAMRQREIGVRLALGARPASIRNMVFGEGGRLAIIGLVIGVAGAVALGRLVSSFLFGVTAFDVPTIAVTVAVLGVMTIIASWIPARRATRVDPITAIRAD